MLFDGRQVRSLWDAEKEKWYFSIADTVAILTDSVDPGAYWRKLKERLKREGNETVTNCHGLKMLSQKIISYRLLKIIRHCPKHIKKKIIRK